MDVPFESFTLPRRTEFAEPTSMDVVDAQLREHVEAARSEVAVEVPEHHFVVPRSVVAITSDGHVNVPRTAQLALHRSWNG